MGGGETVDGFSVKDTSESGVDLYEELQIDPDVHVKRDGSPVVLLYSTHASESFLLSDTDWYYTDDDFRSTEPDESILSVAAEAAAVIEAGGFGVIHDTTLHDYPAYSGSYDRSMETIRKNLEAYPTIQITVDVHRDAFGEDEDGTRYKPVAEVNGKDAAQIMILTGCDLSEDPLFPDWRENLHFALRLQQKGKRCSRGCTGRCFFTAQLQHARHARFGSRGGRHGGEHAQRGAVFGAAARRDDPRGSERPCGIGAPRRGHTRYRKRKKEFCTMHSRFRTRPFLISFLCTALALLFLVGILVVDAEGRRLSFNDTSPALELVYNADGTADMQVNAFRLDRQFDVTGLVRVWHFIADFFCIPHGRFPEGANAFASAG